MKVEEDKKEENRCRPFSSLLKAAYLLLSSSAFFLFICCTGHPGEVRIKGELEHLDQGEFLIYSSDEALDRVDTLHISDGSFSYTLLADETATLHILYPNQSELAVFADPGADIRIRGDARSLSEVKVTGSENNEHYTAFRMEANGKAAGEVKEMARRYILEQPTLAASRYLFTNCFLLDAQASARETTELYDSLCRACPDDVALAKLAPHVRTLGLLRVGEPLPDFSLSVRQHDGTNDGAQRIVRRDDYKGKPLLIAFWASWKGGSKSVLFRSRKLRRELEGRGKGIALLSYSLDAGQGELSRTMRRDSVDWPCFCDFRGFLSPLVREWGIWELPYVILVTPDGRIAAAGTNWQRDIAPAIDKL